MKSIILLVIFFSIFLFPPFSNAQDNSCWITAPPQDDVWVKVYDSDRDGNRGPVIWKGKIDAGREVKITSTEGRIRYDYTRDRNQPYEGDKSVGCYDEKRFTVD